MIFHIPTETTLVSTDVAYQVPLYDENATYNDGDEVRKGDDIYTVSNYTEEVANEVCDSNRIYNIGDFVNIGTDGYEKIDEIISIGATWDELSSGTFAIITNTTGEANGYDSSYVEYAEILDWDGVTYDTYIKSLDTHRDTKYFKFHLAIHKYSLEVGYYSDIEITIADDADGTNSVNIAGFKYKSEGVPEYGNYVYKNSYGVMCVKYAKDSSFISSNGIVSNLWRYAAKTQFLNKHKLNYLRPSIKKLPFDTKQYTSVKAVGSQTWKIKPRGYHSNAVVIGGVKGYMLTVMFMNSASEIISMQQIDLTVNKLTSTQLRDDGNPVEIGDGSVEASTQIVYLPLETTPYYVEIQVDDQAGLGSEIGWIMATSFIDVGATNLEFTHNIKNFDKNKVSEVSGYIDHIKGQRVVQHSGSFDIPLTDYDKMLMINKRFTQELIAIDGSDTTNNEASDSQNRFQSTKLIGRVKRLGMQTRTKQNKLDDTQTITFEFEEIV